eukprot:GHVQ01024024.1.p1 GENE.GHVQ01024024.1~~GHVQ01024024.1.p1  ORF type:complete len:483 (-),score=61.57 GHVQ01024024.1:602-2050(-)
MVSSPCSFFSIVVVYITTQYQPMLLLSTTYLPAPCEFRLRRFHIVSVVCIGILLPSHKLFVGSASVLCLSQCCIAVRELHKLGSWTSVPCFSLPARKSARRSLYRNNSNDIPGMFLGLSLSDSGMCVGTGASCLVMLTDKRGKEKRTSRVRTSTERTARPSYNKQVEASMLQQGLIQIKRNKESTEGVAAGVGESQRTVNNGGDSRSCHWVKCVDKLNSLCHSGCVGSAEGRVGVFVVLGIETSCDDTAVAVVRSDGVLLSEERAGQEELCRKYLGVNPAAAGVEHSRVIERVINRAVLNAGLSGVGDVDVIASTIGPGLDLCLRVGYDTAKELCRVHSKPFVAVHHMEAHLLSARLPTSAPHPKFMSPRVGDWVRPRRVCGDPLRFPYLGVVMSGGHSMVTLVRGIADYTLLAETYDDAVGEAFDKTARALGLPVDTGGGPAIEAAATHCNLSAEDLPHLPEPFKNNPNTAMLRSVPYSPI